MQLIGDKFIRIKAKNQSKRKKKQKENKTNVSCWSWKRHNEKRNEGIRYRLGHLDKNKKKGKIELQSNKIGHN